MSVLMVMRVHADAKKLEQHASESAETFQTILARAKDHGVISHKFYGSDTEVMVIDEWPSEEACHAFIQASPEIPELVKAAGGGHPEISFYRSLDTGDEI